MSAALAAAAIARGLRRPAGAPGAAIRRWMSEQPAEIHHGLMEPVKKPPSRIRVVFFGFLAGMATTSFGGWYWLQDEIHVATEDLKDGARSVSREIEKITTWMSLTDSLTAEVERLKREMARREELAALIESVRDERSLLEAALAEHKREVHENQRDLFAAMERLQQEHEQA